MGRNTRHELYGIAAKLDSAHVACCDGRTDLWVNPEDIGSAIEMLEESLGGRYHNVMHASSGRRMAIVHKEE